MSRSKTVEERDFYLRLCIQEIGEQKKRQRRKWFSTKYYASVMNITEFYEENLGWQFCGLISFLNKKNFSKNH